MTQGPSGSITSQVPQGEQRPEALGQVLTGVRQDAANGPDLIRTGHTGEEVENKQMRVFKTR